MAKNALSTPRKPLLPVPPRWGIDALYSILTARKGVSALQLSKELGVQYRTAWHMLHRIREACGRGDFTLGGDVEVDETYIGGREPAKHASKKAQRRARRSGQDYRGGRKGARRQGEGAAGVAQPRRHPDPVCG